MKKFINKKYICALLVASCFLFVFSQASQDIFSRDLCFMIAPGREILKNGFINENVWLIGDGYKMPVQSWLYCVILALADNGGDIFSWIFLLVQIFSLFFIAYMILKVSKIEKYTAISISAIFTAVTPIIGNLRPETITTVFLLIEIFGIEKYKEKNNKKWLYLLPLTTLLEINIHASMWLPHFLILIAYLVPSVIPSKINNNSLFNQKKSLILPFSLMSISLFLNPYGLDNILYSFKSLLNKESSISEASGEMLPIDVISVQSFVILIGIGIISFLYINKKLNSETLYLFLGFSFMTIIHRRSETLLYLSMLILIKDLVSFVYTDIKHLNIKKINIGVTSISLIFIVLTILSIPFLGQYKNIDQTYSHINLSMISAGINKDDNILCGPGIGTVLEYYDYRNIYCDYRAELMTKEINEKYDILREMVDYCFNGYKTIDGKHIKIADEEMMIFIDKYKFKYFIVTKEEEGFRNFIENSNKFQEILTIKNIKYLEDATIYIKNN